MNSLIVGDVGCGSKTEVVMRAAAKVAPGGKQLAVLCPATIFCFQHFITFKERSAGFPMHIENLNCFADKADGSQI